LRPRGVENNLKVKVKGNADAQLNLGDMYSQGQGVKQDEVKAVLWYRKAAEQGDVISQ